MEREIKFRAWDVKRNKMIHFSNPQICSEYNQLAFTVEEEEEKEYLGCLPDNKIEIMQFTGLKDRNGKEIFEGDILKDNMKFENSDEHPLVLVEWRDNDVAFIFKGINGGCYIIPTGYVQDFEIIGNKFQNPELLQS